MNELSGKELGIAVAKEVMEWREGREWQDKDVAVWFDDGCDVVHVLRRDSHSNVRLGGWAPWRDLNDCWQVVEKLRTDGYDIYVGLEGGLILAEIGIAIDIGGGESEWTEWDSGGDTVPEAILRAALKAVKGGEG